MSRPCTRWTAAIENFDDHPETKYLPYIERTLCDQMVKDCSSKKIVDGVLTPSVVWQILNRTLKSHPVLYRYRRALIESKFIIPQDDGNFFSPLAKRLCLAACRNASGQKVFERFVKESFVPENAAEMPESADSQNMKLTSPVPNLKEDLSKRLKADEHLHRTPGVEPEAAIVDVPAQPREHRRTVACIQAMAPEALAAMDRGAPEETFAAAAAADEDAIGGIATKILANNPFALAAQEVDFGAMSTEEIWAWEKHQEAAMLLDGFQGRAAGLKAAQEAQLLEQPHGGETLKPPKTTRASSAYRDMVRGHLMRFAGRVAGFCAGAREVNTICKMGPSEHQLVNCLDIARRKVQKGVVANPGGYLNNTLRNVVAGIVPPRKALPCKFY